MKPILQASRDKLRRYLVFRFFIELFNYDIHNFNVRYTSENEHENLTQNKVSEGMRKKIHMRH